MKQQIKLRIINCVGLIFFAVDTGERQGPKKRCSSCHYIGDFKGPKILKIKEFLGA